MENLIAGAVGKPNPQLENLIGSFHKEVLRKIHRNYLCVFYDGIRHRF